MNAMFRLIAIITPNQTICALVKPNSRAAGTNKGMAMKLISMNSRLMPNRKMAILATIINPQNPPGRLVNRLCT